MDGRDGAPISLNGVAVHSDCWCVCLCYLHLHQKIQKMAKCTFWYQLTQVVPDKVQRAVDGCVCVCVMLQDADTNIWFILHMQILHGMLCTEYFLH